MFLPSNITLKFGDSGDFVVELQRRLVRIGHYADDQVQGVYGAATVQAVTAFQMQERLNADGVAGPETLRRLNGIIAGDTSSAAASQQEEETQHAYATSVAQEQLLATPPEQPYYPSVSVDIAPAAPLHEPAPVSIHVEPARAPEPPMQQHAPHAPTVAVSAAPSPAEIMAAMPQPAPAQPGFLPPPAQPVFGAQPPRADIPPVVAEPRPSHDTPADMAAQPARSGMLSRATQFADRMMQKLADYFEAKLPANVLREVQAIGQVMAAAGLRENPIPSGPELPTRSPELPTRGTEQAQQRV